MTIKMIKEIKTMYKKGIDVSKWQGDMGVQSICASDIIKEWKKK